MALLLVSVTIMDMNMSMRADAAPTGLLNCLPGDTPSLIPGQFGSKEVANRRVEKLPDFRILMLRF